MYWSRNSWMSNGLGSSSSLTSPVSASSSSMISLHRSMHSSQMYTPGPAMSFFTCFWLFPQKEHFSRSPPSPIRAMTADPCPLRHAREHAWIFGWTETPGAVSPTTLEARSCACCLRRYLPTPIEWENLPIEMSDSADQVARARAGAGPCGTDCEQRLTACWRTASGRQEPRPRSRVTCLVGGQDLVALDVRADVVGRLVRVPRQRRLHQAAHPLDLVRLDLQVRHLAVDALHGGLVDQHAGVGQGVALARGAGREQHGRRGRRLAEAVGLHVRTGELHRVVDRHQRGERATRRVDVHDDVAVRVDRLQVEQLRHHVVGRRVVDLHADEDDPLFEQLVVRVGLLDPVAGPLHEGGQHVPGLGGVKVAHYQVSSVWPGQLPLPLDEVTRVTTWSTKPYSRASSAVNQRSRSASAVIRSTDWPVWSAVSWAISSFHLPRISARMAMSDAVPPTPPEG